MELPPVEKIFAYGPPLELDQGAAAAAIIEADRRLFSDDMNVDDDNNDSVDATTMRRCARLLTKTARRTDSRHGLVCYAQWMLACANVDPRRVHGVYMQFMNFADTGSNADLENVLRPHEREWMQRQRAVADPVVDAGVFVADLGRDDGTLLNTVTGFYYVNPTPVYLHFVAEGFVAPADRLLVSDAVETAKLAELVRDDTLRQSLLDSIMMLLPTGLKPQTDPEAAAAALWAWLTMSLGAGVRVRCAYGAKRLENAGDFDVLVWVDAKDAAPPRRLGVVLQKTAQENQRRAYGHMAFEGASRLVTWVRTQIPALQH